MQVLAITDEIRASSVIHRGLTWSGLEVMVVGEKTAGLAAASESNYEVIVLDNDLGHGKAHTLASKLRVKLPQVKIILLMSKEIDEEKKVPQEYGVDDILVKPFIPGDLRRKILELTGKKGPPSILTADDLVLHSLKMRVVRGGKEIVLTEKEFVILEYLLLRKEQILSREEILEFTWDYHFESVSNMVDMFIAHLRKKIDSQAKIKLIQTYSKKGYAISEAGGLFD